VQCRPSRVNSSGNGAQQPRRVAVAWRGANGCIASPGGWQEEVAETQTQEPEVILANCVTWRRQGQQQQQQRRYKQQRSNRYKGSVGVQNKHGGVHTRHRQYDKRVRVSVGGTMITGGITITTDFGRGYKQAWGTKTAMNARHWADRCGYPPFVPCPPPPGIYLFNFRLLFNIGLNISCVMSRDIR